MIGAIFDWDGVVIDSAVLHEKSWEILAKKSIKIPRIISKRVWQKKRNDNRDAGLSDDKLEIIKLGNQKEEIYWSWSKRGNSTYCW